MLSGVEGRVLDGKYRVVRALRRGSSGTTYDGIHETLEKPVRIFVPVVEDPRRFIATSNAIANVAALDVIDFGIETDGTCYVVTEARHAERLDQRLRATGRVPEQEAIAIVSALLDVLSAMHGLGAFHGALEPEWIAWDGSSIHLTGFAFTVGGPTNVDPDRTAPELLHAMPPQAQTDVFAAGVLLRELVGEASPGLAAIIERATARSPDRRHPTARAMRADLERLRSETTSPDPVGAHTFQSGSYPGTIAPLTHVAPARRSGATGLIAVVSVAAIAVAAYFALQTDAIEPLRAHVESGAYGSAESYALEAFDVLSKDPEAIRLVHAAMAQRRDVELEDASHFDPSGIVQRGKWSGELLYERGKGAREGVVFMFSRVDGSTLEGWVEVPTRQVRTRFIGYYVGNHLVLWETEILEGSPEARENHALHEKMSFYIDGDRMRSVATQYGAIVDVVYEGGS